MRGKDGNNLPLHQITYFNKECERADVQDNAKKYHSSLITGALITALIYVFLNYESPYQLIFLVAFIPLIKNIKTVAENKIPAALDSELKKVALRSWIFMFKWNSEVQNGWTIKT